MPAATAVEQSMPGRDDTPVDALPPVSLVDPSHPGDAAPDEGDSMPGDEPTQHIGFRVPASLVARIDAYAERLQASVPRGVRVTRTDAVRALLEYGLEQVEGGADSDRR